MAQTQQEVPGEAWRSPNWTVHISSQNLPCRRFSRCPAELLQLCSMSQTITLKMDFPQFIFKPRPWKKTRLPVGPQIG